MSRISNAVRKAWEGITMQDVDLNALQCGVAIGGATIFGGYVALHTVLLDKYKDFLQLYRNGFVTPLSPQITTRIAEVVKDVNLKAKYKSYLGAFYTAGFEPLHIGSFKMRGGAYVGIPGNFDYKSTDDIERDLILIRTKPVSWNSESGELFQDSLILSEKAQKFAVARELCHLDTYYVYYYGLIGAAAVYNQYLWSAYLSVKTYGPLKPKSFRYTLYSIVGIFTYGLWATATDLLTKYYEQDADKKASSLGIDYAKGAVELYTKLARRNIATRELLGTEGENLFTKYGNPNHELIRQRHIPISVRKERAEDRVQKMLNVQPKIESKVDNDNIA